MTMPAVDWNEVWREFQVEKSHHRLRNSEFWNERAPEFTRAVTKTDYVNQFLDILQPQPDWSILDIGSAAGTLAVPLSGLARAVTALEPSSRMREFLAERCERERIDNIRIVEGRWQDDWESLGIAPHDVAISSRSLMVEDLRAAIEKLNRFATRRAVLSTMVGDGPHDAAIIASTGRTPQASADYIVVYNLLRQMNIFANVAFTCNRERKVWADLDAAVNGLRWMLHHMTGEEESRLREHLRATLVRVDGGWSLPYPKTVRWAVLWWDKDDCPTLGGEAA